MAIDKSLAVNETALQTLLEIDELVEQAWRLERSTPALMLTAAEHAHRRAVAVGYAKGVVRSLIVIGRAQLRLGNLTEAERYLSQAQASDAVDDLLQAQIFNARGIVHLYLKIWDKAFAYYQQGLSVARRIRDKGLEARLLNNIGEIYREHRDFDTALTYYKRSLEAQVGLSDFNAAAVPVSNLSLTCLELGELDQAEHYAEEAFHIAEEKNDRMIQSTSLRYRAIIARRRGQREQAIQHLNASLAIYRSTREMLHAAQAMLEFHRLYFDEGNCDLSLKHLQEALRVAEEADSLPVRVEIYTELARVYESLGDIEAALRYYKQRLQAVATMEQQAMEQRLRAFSLQVAIDESFQEKEAYRALSEQLEEKTRELASLSNRDGLTNIANRRHFDQFLEHTWSQALRQRKDVSLLMIDVDCLKEYNDTYGHLAGDEVIKRIAETMQRCVKRSTDLVARFGGDEFVVLLGDTGADGALHVAEEIQRAVAACAIRQAPGAASTNVTVSIGVATMVPTRETERCELIARGDKALYRAKQAGRACIRVSQ